MRFYHRRTVVQRQREERSLSKCNRLRAVLIQKHVMKRAGDGAGTSPMGSNPRLDQMFASIGTPKSTEAAPLTIGSLVCLFDEERQGYVMNYQSSSVHNHLVIAPDQQREYPIVPNVQAIQYQICVPHRFKCSKMVPLIRKMYEENPTDVAMQTRYENALKLAEIESSENHTEQERQTGKQMLYGQMVQLRHAFTQKWVHGNSIQTSFTEPSSMTIELKSELAKTALFKVLPCSKVKTEGEPVQIGDRVLFESVKSPGQYWHSSRLTLGSREVCSDCYELNLSVRPTGFNISMSHHPFKDQSINSDLPISPRRYVVFGGSFVRLYHCEAEAYLSLEGIAANAGENLHLRVRRFDPLLPRTINPSTSATNYWQIEKESGPLDCDRIKWDDQVKLRHSINRRYLCIRDGQFKMSVDPNDDEVMLFKLVPVVKRSDYLTLDTAVRIQHVESKVWLRGGYKPYTPNASVVGHSEGKKVPWSTAELKQIVTSRDMCYDDAFSLQKVTDENVAEANYVAGMVPFLHKFCDDFDYNLQITNGIVSHWSARIIKRMEKAVKELEAFLYVDGMPCKRRQKLLRNFMIVDICVQLLKQRSALIHGQISVPGRDAKSTMQFVNSYLEPVFAAVISVLRAYVHGESRKNELYIGRHMDFFLTQIEDTTTTIGLTATQMTVELLKNNRKLVDRFSTKQIDKIIVLVKKEVNFRQLELLTALCECNEATLSRNQDYITEEIVRKPILMGENVLLMTELGQNIGHRANNVYVSWDSGQSWQSMSEFTTQSFGTEYYLFLKNQLNLFVALCKGRNSAVVEILVDELKLVTWEECYICITNHRVADEIRAIYCAMLYEMFINVGENFIHAHDMDLVFNFAKIPTPMDGKRTMSLAQPTYSIKRFQTVHPTMPLQFINPLKLWINDFFTENDSLVASNDGRNALITEVLKIVPKLVRLGYYGHADIQTVLVPILGLLESSDDVPFSVEELEDAPEDVQKAVEQYRHFGRYENNKRNATLAKVKIAACQAAELFLELRTSVRLSRLLCEFKNIVDFETSKMHHPLGRLLYTQYDFSSPALNQQAVNILKEIFQQTYYLSEIDLVKVTVDLCRYEFKSLVAESMYLLTRYHSSFGDVLKNAGDAQLIVTPKSLEVHQFITNNLRTLRLMLADRNIDIENSLRMKDILAEFSKLCYLEGDPYNECHPINQQILYNSGVLGDIFDIITGTIDTEEDSLSHVHESCFMLLQGMARRNPVVQQRLFDRMAAFFKVEGVSDYLSELFVEIFAGNRELCARIAPSVVSELAAELARTNNPTLIRLMSALVMIDQKPVKRNQQLVVKALLQHKHSIEIVTDSDNAKLLNIMSREDKNATPEQRQEQRYVTNIVQLLAYCSLGDNKSVESICQTMFTLHQLLDIIMLPNICDGLRAPFVQFLLAVFFTSDLDIAVFELKELSHEPKLWAYIDSLSTVIRKCTVRIRAGPSIAHKHLRQRPTRVHLSKDDTEHEFKETLHYLFDAVLPFLDIFYGQYFQRFDEHCMMEGADEAESQQSSSVMSEVLAAEQTISLHLLRNALIPFIHAVQPVMSESYQAENLKSAMASIVDNTGLQEELPTIVYQPLANHREDPINRYREYYAEEQCLNLMLCSFVDNVRLAYCGPNTVRAQIGYPSDMEYCYQYGDKKLPLGAEFQQLVNSFKIASDSDSITESWGPLRAVIKHVANSMRLVYRDERAKIRAEELLCRSLQVLRAVLHNEICKVPTSPRAKPKDILAQQEQIAEMQNLLVEAKLIEAVIPLLTTNSEGLMREALAVTVDALFGGSTVVQERFMKIFLSERETPFFEAMKFRLMQTVEQLREKKLLEQKSHKQKNKNKMLTTLETDPHKAIAKALKSTIKYLPSQLAAFPLKIDMPANELYMKQTNWWDRWLQRMTGQKNKVGIEDPYDHTKIQRIYSPSRHDELYWEPPKQDQTVAKPELALGDFGKIFEKMRTKYYTASILNRMMRATDTTTDLGQLRLLLQVLARLCDGQNSSLQDYLHDQWDNFKTVDLVGEACDLLPWLIGGHVTGDTIGIVTQLLQTIIEMLQGNETNQTAAFDHKVLDNVTSVLRFTSFPRCSLADIFELKRTIGVLLTDMTEENTESAHTKIIMDTMNKSDIANQMMQAYELLQDQELVLATGQEDLIISVGFTYHHLLCRALDVNPTLDASAFAETDAFQYFMAHTQSIELQKGSTLQRVYFTVEDYEVLRRTVKERVKWEVDRSSPSNKLRDFMAWSREVCDDIRYQRKIQSNVVSRFLVNNWALLNITMLLLTFVINLIVLFGWIAPEKYKPEYTYSVVDGNYWPDMSPQVRVLVLVFGTLHMFVCALLCASYLLANRPTVPPWLAIALRKAKSIFVKPDKKKQDAKPLRHSKNSYLSINLLSPSGLYYPGLLLLSIIATYSNGAWFCFHMLHIVNENQLLRRAIQAITLNGRSMLWVVFLGVILLYIYALVGFLFLRNIFVGNQLYCASLWECFVSVLRNGLMFGMADHFDIPDGDDNNEFSYYALKAIYDISFFALVTTIGLNMIFGIIIDTFSQLREAKFQIEQDMIGTCFICNRQNYEFEHHGRGFQHHVKVEHNMWTYLFFFIHLGDTPANDLSALELYVHQQIQKDGWDFFPLNRALSLMDWEEDNSDARIERLISQVDFLVEHIRCEDLERERAAQEAVRDAKRSSVKNRNNQWFHLTRRDSFQMRSAHALYGPYMVKLTV